MTTAKIKYDKKSQNRSLEFRLEKNTPNPFDTETSIRFCIPRRCDVKLALTNNRDEVVCVLVNTPLAAGCYTIIWDAIDHDGQRIASGNYTYRLEANGFMAIRKLEIINLRKKTSAIGKD